MPSTSHDGGQWLEETLMQCAPYVADSVSRLVPELAEPEATAPEDDDWARQRLFAAVETTLTGLATERRLGLLVEDLHWADTTTLDLIEHLVTRGSEVPMVGTWRLDDRAIDRANVEWFNRVRRFSHDARTRSAEQGRDPGTAHAAERESSLGSHPRRHPRAHAGPATVHRPALRPGRWRRRPAAPAAGRPA